MATVQELIMQNHLLCDELKRVLINIKKLGKPSFSDHTLNSAINSAKSTFNQALGNHAKILSLVSVREKSTLPYLTDNMFDMIRAQYDAAIEFLNAKLEEKHPDPPAVFSPRQNYPGTSAEAPVFQLPAYTHAQVRLPLLDIPKFSGNIEEWPSFADRFDAAIHNHENLRSVDKLQYLQSCLTGDAAKVIQGLSLTEANYAIARTNLKNRYANKRMISTALFKKFMSIESAKHDSLRSLKQLRDNSTATIAAIGNLGYATADWNPLLIHILVEKLDLTLHLAWETLIAESAEYPELAAFQAFLDTRIRALEGHNLTSTKNLKDSSHPRRASAHNVSVRKISCLKCEQEHYLNKCPDFLALSVMDRSKFANLKKLCRNCLHKAHTAADCNIKFRCFKCQKKHHTLLHYDTQENQTISNNNSVQGTVTAGSHLGVSEEPVLLPTAIVKLRTADDREIITRALIDQCSQISAISENLVQLLRLKKQRTKLHMSGTGAPHPLAINSRVRLEVLPTTEENSAVAFAPYVLKTVSKYAPSDIKLEWFPALENVKLADTLRKPSNPIEIIIGSDIYAKIRVKEELTSESGELIAQNSIFGWLVSGPLPCSPTTKILHSVSHHCCDLANELRRFWHIEEVPDASTLSESDQYCEDFYSTTTFQDESGRFVVRLPFKQNMKNSLGPSRHIAEASLIRLENKMSKDETCKVKYTEFMREYEDLKHMSVINNENSIQPHTPPFRVFLPHHAVFRVVDGRSKIRVVFNASAKTATSVSLNDTLHIGPKLQADITAIILNWRAHKYAAATDIVKMFRAILIHSDDRKFQNVMWRDEQGNLKAFELNTVTYGTGPAPFLANRTILELANRHGEKFPAAAQILRRSVYVDDILFGGNSVDDLVQLKFELISLLEEGQFQLSKWASNSEEFNASTFSSLEIRDIKDENESTSKILGIIWDPKSDFFRISVAPLEKISYTKRSILSVIARIYDPLGWLSPLVVTGKQFLQSLWHSKLNWDDELPIEIRERWDKFVREIPPLTKIQIPRWDNFDQLETQCVELIGFSDASQHAYSAVVYMRCMHSAGNVTTTLVMAKTKVAPLKTMSIPRLELCGATLLAKLLTHVKTSLTRTVAQIICFSDSEIVLAWLAKEPCTWGTFVANRARLIQELLPEATWGHVRSKFNPADLNSRGISCAELEQSSLWWHGPTFLLKDKIELRNKFDTNEEKRKTSHLAVNVVPEIILSFCNFSSWPRLLRACALWYKYFDVLKRKITSKDTLTSAHIKSAKNFIVRVLQKFQFPEEIASLKGGKALSPSSKLKKLCPFFDENGVLRVGGRLENSFLRENEKHPIILDSHHVTDLIISDIHTCTLHGGTQVTLNVLRKSFWILKARNRTKDIIHKCVKCVRQRAHLGHQFMGSLPEPRVTPSATFAHTGVDYAGPFALRLNSGRGYQAIKAYFAVFVCFSTRAIHLELVKNYDTKSFLDAFDRFACRRGSPVAMYSDHALNFIAGNKELKASFQKSINSSEFQNLLAEKEIVWHFIPPGSPHVGGLWESGVRLVKHHLKRVMGDFTPVWDELLTILCRVEACLNSRPISRLYDDPESLEVLTPGHFLIGRPLLVPPRESVLELSESRLTRWQKISRITEQFWRKWSEEYLHTLQSRQKWSEKNNDLKIGDLVLLRNPTAPPSRWSMGRVVQMHVGENNVCRTATVKTQKSVLDRHVTQLCKLLDVQSQN